MYQPKHNRSYIAAFFLLMTLTLREVRTPGYGERLGSPAWSREAWRWNSEEPLVRLSPVAKDIRTQRGSPKSGISILGEKPKQMRWWAKAKRAWAGMKQERTKYQGCFIAWNPEVQQHLSTKSLYVHVCIYRSQFPFLFHPQHLLYRMHWLQLTLHLVPQASEYLTTIMAD